MYWPLCKALIQRQEIPYDSRPYKSDARPVFKARLLLSGGFPGGAMYENLARIVAMVQNVLRGTMENRLKNRVSLALFIVALSTLIVSKAAVCAETDPDRPKFPLKRASDENHFYIAIGRTVLLFQPSEGISALSLPLGHTPLYLSPPDQTQMIGCYANPFQITGFAHAETFIETEEQRWPGVKDEYNHIAIDQLTIGRGGYSVYAQESLSKFLCGQKRLLY